MNRRKNLAQATVCVILLVALLVPLALLMSHVGHGKLDEKQTAIARALEMERERSKLPPLLAVQAAPDIEVIWEIEDAREETDAQLVESMFCGADEMGYDSESRTFYATLGIDNGDEWPEIVLSARGVQGVQVVWVDDYSYDWCSDAIAEGYRYELLAYTDTQYAYIGVVFTGLPIVTLHTEEEIVMGTDVAGRATVSAAGYEPVDTAMIVHRRGGGAAKRYPKYSFRMEFHEIGSSGGDEKKNMSLLGMKEDSDWLLIGNVGDDTAVRNHLCWDIWRDWHEDGSGLMLLDSKMVEVFVNDEYLGLYQLMERVKEEEQIAAAGGDADTDCVVRFISSYNPTAKPSWDMEDAADLTVEYRYERSGNAKRAFELAKDYVSLSRIDEQRLDNEAFAALALERVDIEDLMNYILFFHICTLGDNSTNNVYLYIMQQEDGRFVYRYGPWDMDSSFWIPKEQHEHNTLRWPDLSMVVPARMLELNVGNCREVLWKLWNEKRAGILSEESMHERMAELEEYINASGAALRESEKWFGEAVELNLSEVEYYNAQCINLVRQTIEGAWSVEGMSLMQ